MKQLLITIDGPAGAGKTTVSRRLANRLGYRYVDTGALYRAVAYEVSRRGLEPHNMHQLSRLCRCLNVDFQRQADGWRLISNDVDITDHIRTPEISLLASTVSAMQPVRSFLLEVQRQMGRRKGVVFEGRDMGTVVFPDAGLKFFLDASPETRARRRYDEIKTRAKVNLEDVAKDMHQRDASDSRRKIAPLRAAEDAILIDSTHLSVEEVVEKMLSYIKENDNCS